jgi:hypothetical protein
MTALALVAFGLAFFVTCSDGDSARAGTAPTGPSQSSPDLSTWLTYANQQYGVTLKYPSTYKVMVLQDQLQPAPIFRVGLQLASITRPSGMETPQFAIDVFDNAAHASLDAWLASHINLARTTRDAVQVGGENGIRIGYEILLAPNTFYYVARGSYVYRFTPLGLYSDDMLKTVQFTS